MAAVAPTKTSEYTQYSAGPQQMVRSVDWGANLRFSVGRLTFTTAGFSTASAGDLSLIRMPAGRVVIIPWLCHIHCPAGSSTSDLDVGNGAYADQDGAAVAADGNHFADSLDAGAEVNSAFVLPDPDVPEEFYSQDGFDIVASFDTANSPGSGTMTVCVAYLIGR